MIHDAHLDKNKTAPLSVAEYSVLLMFSTHGRCYSFAEMEMLLKKQGFIDICFQKSVANRSIITGNYNKVNQLIEH